MRKGLRFTWKNSYISPRYEQYKTNTGLDLDLGFSFLFPFLHPKKRACARIAKKEKSELFTVIYAPLFGIFPNSNSCYLSPQPSLLYLENSC